MQIKYEFQSTLHRNQARMLDAIAQAWLSAGGNNNAEQQRDCLNAMTDADMAAHAIAEFGLDLDAGDTAYGEDPRSHQDLNCYDRVDLSEAFARLRANLAKPAFTPSPEAEAIQARLSDTFDVKLTGGEIAEIQWALFSLYQDAPNPLYLTLCNRLRAIIGAEPMPDCYAPGD